MYNRNRTVRIISAFFKILSLQFYLLPFSHYLEPDKYQAPLISGYCFVTFLPNFLCVCSNVHVRCGTRWLQATGGCSALNSQDLSSEAHNHTCPKTSLQAPSEYPSEHSGLDQHCGFHCQTQRLYAQRKRALSIITLSGLINLRGKCCWTS